MREIVESFHALHETHYSVRSPGDAVEFTEWTLRAVGRMPETVLPVLASPSAPRERKVRQAWFRETGRAIEVPVHALRSLPAGEVIPGPALIEDDLTTAVVPPGARAVATSHGNILITLAGIEGRAS